MIFFRYALIRSLRNKTTVITLCLLPSLLLFIPSFWIGEYKSGFPLIGMVIMYVGFLLVRTIMTDRINGTIKRIFAAPVTTYQYLSNNLLAYQFIMVIQVTLITLLGILLYKWDLTLAIQTFLCYTIFAGTSISFGLAWNSIFSNKDISDAVFGAISSLMALLGGIYIPIDLLPGTLDKIGMIMPTYWMANAFRAISTHDLMTYLISITALILFTFAFLIFGSKRRLG